MSDPVFETDTWLVYKPESYQEYSQFCDHISENSFNFYLKSACVCVFKSKVNSENYSLIWSEEQPIFINGHGSNLDLDGFMISYPEINNFIQGLRQQ